MIAKVHVNTELCISSSHLVKGTRESVKIEESADVMWSGILAPVYVVAAAAHLSQYLSCD